MSEKRLTLTEIAREAGVSLSTASKVLNGHDDVATSTRTRVEKVARDRGYQSKLATRRKTRASIEFLVDRLASPFAMEILRGVTLAAEEADVDVVVGRFRPGSTDTDTKTINRVANAGRLGAIVITAQLTEETTRAIEEAGLPVVFIDPLKVDDESIVSVGSTNWIGGRSAAEHLLSLGHKELGIIGGPKESISASARLDGFKSSAAEGGVLIDPKHVQHCLFDYDEACEAAKDILKGPSRPTAIFASNDIQAMGVLEAARQLRIIVPQDLSLVTYDDTYLASWATPPLTAVYQPLQDIGQVAMRTILRINAGEKLDSHHIELATRLNIRDSTSRPKG